MLRYRYEALKTIEPFYSGGNTQVEDGCIYATYFNKLSLFTNNKLKQIEVDEEQITCFYKSTTMAIIANKALQLSVFNSEFELQRQIKTPSLLTSCAIDASETLAAFGGSDGIIHVYDLKNRYYTHKLTGHRSLVTKVEFFSYNNHLFLSSCGDDGTVRFWNLKNSRSFIFKHHDALIRNAVIYDKVLLIVSRDQTISLWHFDAIMNDFSVNLESVLISTVAVNETAECGQFISSRFFFTGGESGKLKIWDLDNLNGPIKIININEPVYDSHRTGFSTFCIVTQHQNFYNLQIDENLDISVIDHVIGYNDEVLQVGILNNDILAATNSNNLRLFCRNGSSKILHGNGHTNLITCFDIKSNQVLTGSKDSNCKLWLYDVALQSLDCKKTFTGHVGSVSDCCFGDDLIYTVSSDLTMKCWNMDGSCKFTVKAHDKDINCITIYKGIVATTSQDKSIKLWNSATGSLINSLMGHKRSVWSCNFNKKEKALVSGSGDMTVKIWSLSDYACIRTLEGHFQSVLNVNFFNDYSEIISSGSDGLIKIWDAATGAELQTIEAHEGKVWGCCTFEDEIISGGTDAKITIYKDHTLEHQEEELKLKETEIQKNQALDNLVRKCDYVNALKYAAELKMPGKFMDIFKIAYNKDTDIVKETRHMDLSEYMPNWLSYHKHSFYAQLILNQLLLANKQVEAKELLGLTEKQFNRLDQLLIDTNILKITHLQSAPIESKRFKTF
eukprot:NODE_414_length_9102_cov_0.404754.p1 type:complete len:729 gc:universal NODE_414_length_9102_cov_0.404754:4025-1839(-)